MASESGHDSPDPLLPRRRVPSSGGWKSALFIIWVEVAERFAYFGISSNLISYLTGPLGQTTAAAAAAVNAWSGAASMLPLLGAAVADSWLGRYRTIVASSVLYITGLGMLTLSSMFPSPQQCGNSADGQGVCAPSSVQKAFFYVSLYLVAIAQSGHKPCVQAFGADQFDATDPSESSSRASFFNWWYFGLCASGTVTVAIMSYVQDNVGWAIGFGVPSMVMLLALAIFLLGTRTYRFYGSGGGVNGGAGTFSLVGKAFVAWRKRSPESGLVEYGEHGDGELAEDAVLAEEVKGLARLFPIWATCLLYGVVFAQPSTLFTKQAATLDRRVGQSFQIPPAALQCFLGVSIVACIVLYDRVLVPMARGVTGVASGITILQRIGTGIALSLVTLAVAALVEMKRLRAARDSGLVDGSASNTAAVPMSLWWIVPQYVLLGAADVFTMVGMQEFFYDQVPGALKSLGLALYLSVLGVGSFISSFLITVIDGVTRRDGGTSWFADDLNRGHLDYFYLLLAALTALELLAFSYFSASYVYRRNASSSN
ncbi:Protein NRT1/ PTR FAMILY 5.10 [Dichanthelium oligosanthes]|uniref:Protein NRT1/ PTR FAMILY 5.10 n=1 Tax=Dichanthelium oligosanthes TaxID=888268 RepID=A0A1E5VV87_9POAL|nr:Protein NRT1/ PTR FAMILY 5.10 [Dichanthelium oligosanthes]